MEQSRLSSPECLTTTQACESCPMQVAAKYCGVLAMAQSSAKLTEEKQNLAADVEYLSRDDRTEFLVPKAIRLQLERDPVFQEEIKAGNWGLIWVDVRGLKFVNDTYSAESGNTLIKTTSERLKSANKEAGELIMHRAQDSVAELTRARHLGPQAEERRRNPNITDLHVRIGGDELAILVRDTTPENLHIIEKRLREVFSVQQSLKLPLHVAPTIASVAAVHATNIANNYSQLTASDIYDEVVNAVDAAHLPEKSLQYTEMWQKVQQHYQDLQKPSDHRDIANLFFNLYFPDLVNRLNQGISEIR